MVDLRPYETLPTIELLRGLLKRWWSLELAFADGSGYVLDHAEGRLAPPNNAFCALALETKEGFKRCNDSLRHARDLARARVGKEARGTRCVVHECHLGFDLVACPIILEGDLAGLLFVGGSVRAPLDAGAAQTLGRKLRESGATPPGGRRLDAALAELPGLPDQELGRLCDLLELGAVAIEARHAEQARVERARDEEKRGRAHELGERYRFESIIGRSRPMQEIFRLLEKIVASESTVLIHGESGTGKELVARAIHYHGPRAERAFVVQNCSAFNDNLLESALFGHLKGSFTGAIKDQKGLFEIADGGTFFLDEVGDMSPALQVKLLRVLQEGTFTPVGGSESRTVDVRVIAATHKDLHQLVQRGEFREDLYYRIHVIQLTIPPLRERIEDLDLLVEHFLGKHHLGRRHPGEPGRRAPPRLTREARHAMRNYPWPGNIRELENEIERLLVLGGDLSELPAELLSSRVREAGASDGGADESARDHDAPGSLKAALDRLERDLIHRGLIRTHWNKSQLAKELGISRSSLIAKAERYGLDRKPDP